MNENAVATIELIAAYEKLKNIPPKERVTMYPSEYDMHFLVDGVDLDKARKLRDTALKALGMTHEEYLSSKQLQQEQQNQECLDMGMNL